MKRVSDESGSLLYRLFLLGIMFGVLWLKEYLWTAFVMALLLYLGDTIDHSDIPDRREYVSRASRPEAAEIPAADASSISPDGRRRRQSCR